MLSRLKRTLAIVIVVLSGMAWMAGCAGLQNRPDYPRVTLAHIVMKEVKAFESVFEVTLRIFNTSDAQLVIRGVDCELSLNGQKIAVGVAREDKTIGPLDTDTVATRLYSSMIDMVRGFIRLPRDEKLSYAISGRVHLVSQSSVPLHVPFSEEGEIKLEPLGKPSQGTSH